MNQRSTKEVPTDCFDTGYLSNQSEQERYAESISKSQDAQFNLFA